jgi:hypothetical protein
MTWPGRLRSPPHYEWIFAIVFIPAATTFEGRGAKSSFGPYF